MHRPYPGTTTFPGSGGNPTAGEIPSFDDIVGAIKDAAVTITKAAATTVALSCQAAASGLPIGPDACAGRVFVTGGMMTPKATQHDISAMARFPLIWTYLLRGPNAEKADGSEAQAARRWYREPYWV